MNKKIKLSIVAGMVITVLGVWQIQTQLKNDRSILFQFKEIFFPSSYSETSSRYIEASLNKDGEYYSHEQNGDVFLKNLEYSKAIEEYKMAINVIENSQDSRSAKDFKQQMPRYYLSQAYTKAELYQEAIEQIDWLLAHKTLDKVRGEFVAQKALILEKLRAVER